MNSIIISFLCFFWNFSFCNTETMQNTQKASSQTPIIIVWAGISGLAAAKELENAWKQVLILEAKDTIGGRIDTKTKSGTTFEMWASWIHGDQKNPVADILKTQGNSLTYTDFDDLKTYINGKEVNKESEEDFFEYAEDYPDKSLQKVFDLFTEEYNITWKEKEYLLFKLKIEIETEFWAGLDKLSFSSIDQWKVLNWWDKLVWGWYEKVIQYLSKWLDIKLNTPVSKIIQSQTWVQVYDTKGGLYTGEKVIVTVPLWVLKKWAIQFEPALSKEKLQAISSLGMGNLHKTFLVFEKSFWEDITALDRLDTSKATSSLWWEFINLQKLTGQPILLALHGGESAKEMEKKDTKTIKKEVLSVLKDIYPEAKEPIDIITSEWHKDNYTLWSYSYLPVWVDGIVYDILAKREGKLYFAWEHTNADFPSTTHGAYLSWIRAAKEILNK